MAKRIIGKFFDSPNGGSEIWLDEGDHFLPHPDQKAAAAQVAAMVYLNKSGAMEVPYATDYSGYEAPAKAAKGLVNFMDIGFDPMGHEGSKIVENQLR